MRYMILIYGDQNAGPPEDSAESADVMQQWFHYTNGMVEAGAFVAGDPLQGIETATTVRKRDGKVLHTDGPFAETKEQLGGYYILECKDLDEALGWAAKAPNLGYGSVEVRPIMEIPART